MSKPHIPYFDFYPADFMNGVRGLTPQEVGVYTMILCRIYEECGPVEFHRDRLATYCGMRVKTFTKVIDRLVDLGKFQLADGSLRNARAMAEISNRADKLKNNSKAGRASAKKRKEKQGVEPTDVQQPLNHTDTDENITPTDNPPSENYLPGARSPVPFVDFSNPTEKQIYDFGKRVLGKSAGGQITRLRKMWNFDDRAVADILRQASEKSSPPEWIAAVLMHTESPKTPDHILFPPEIYDGLL